MQMQASAHPRSNFALLIATLLSACYASGTTVDVGSMPGTGGDVTSGDGGKTATGGSAAGVTPANAEVSASGVWSRTPPFVQSTTGNAVSVYIPPVSAALLESLQ
jgi:hypothetical protein